MDKSALNFDSPVPLYRQLADLLRREISEGQHAVGDRIESEHSLAQRHTVGRPTVRQATDMLVREGVLQRRRGAGTFVLPTTERVDLFSLVGTSEALRAVEARCELLSPPTLRHNTPIGTAYALQRKYSVQDEVLLLEDIWLDATFFPRLEQHELAGQSLSRLVREVYHREPDRAEQRFAIVDSDPLMGAGPLLSVHRRLHFGEHLDKVHAVLLCRTETFQFTQTITTTRP